MNIRKIITDSSVQGYAEIGSYILDSNLKKNDKLKLFSNILITVSSPGILGLDFIDIKKYILRNLSKGKSYKTVELSKNCIRDLIFELNRFKYSKYDFGYLNIITKKVPPEFSIAVTISEIRDIQSIITKKFKIDQHFLISQAFSFSPSVFGIIRKILRFDGEYYLFLFLLKV